MHKRHGAVCNSILVTSLIEHHRRRVFSTDIPVAVKELVIVRLCSLHTYSDNTADSNNTSTLLCGGRSRSANSINPRAAAHALRPTIASLAHSKGTKPWRQCATAVLHPTVSLHSCWTSTHDGADLAALTNTLLRRRAVTCLHRATLMLCCRVANGSGAFDTT
jgi:hypothetical protein